MKKLLYPLRYLWVIYNRYVYRQSREFRFERQCDALERKWATHKEPT